MRERLDIPWCVEGDVNEIQFWGEKKGAVGLDIFMRESCFGGIISLSWTFPWLEMTTLGLEERSLLSMSHLDRFICLRRAMSCS